MHRMCVIFLAVLIGIPVYAENLCDKIIGTWQGDLIYSNDASRRIHPYTDVVLSGNHRYQITIHTNENVIVFSAECHANVIMVRDDTQLTLGFVGQFYKNGKYLVKKVLGDEGYRGSYTLRLLD